VFVPAKHREPFALIALFFSLRTPLNLVFFFCAMNWAPALFRLVNVFFPIVLVVSCERFFTAPLRASDGLVCSPNPLPTDADGR
jgi:hypothetical protein